MFSIQLYSCTLCSSEHSEFFTFYYLKALRITTFLQHWDFWNMEYGTNTICFFSLFILFWRLEYYYNIFPFVPPNSPIYSHLLSCKFMASFLINLYCIHICMSMYIYTPKYKLLNLNNVVHIYVYRTEHWYQINCCCVLLWEGLFFPLPVFFFSRYCCTI